MKRSDSSLAQFKQRIPADVREVAIGRTLLVPLGSETTHITVTPTMSTIRFSLRTRDPSEAKARQGQAAAAVERFWATLRDARPTTLDHRQATALAGDLYRSWADSGADRTIAIVHKGGGEWERDRSEPGEELAGFASAVANLEAAIETNDTADYERLVGPLVDRLLLAKGISRVDAATRPMLLEAFVLALRDAFAARHRNAGGDYGPDPKAARFPAFDPPRAAPTPSPPVDARTSLTKLVEDWWTEQKAVGRKPSTYESYRNTMANLMAFLKHDDARRVTAEDIVRFKDHRLASANPRTGKPISPKTVKDSDLAGLKTIFGWAVANRRMAANPATGLTIKLGKPQKLRSKGFTDDEALAILRAALEQKGSRSERPETTAAKRWVPWLQAYTGARVGELAQLRKADIRQEGPHWVATITPEAGTVKTNDRRDVVLHPHLIEQGFGRFVAEAKGGHLFLRPGPDGDVLGPLQGLKNRLAEFAREIVPDPRVAPNHAWRHRFKTIGGEVGMGDRVLDAIQGHAARTAGDAYGEVTVKAMAAAVAKLPRIEITTEAASR